MITIYSISCLLLTSFYLHLVFNYNKFWNKIKSIPNNPNREKINVSIIVSARNESSSIQKCLKSLTDQKYDGQFEIILVDDFSEDETVEKAQEINPVFIYSLKEVLGEKFKNYPNKKRAIQLGVEKSTYDYIITCDADCHYENNWLDTFSNGFDEKQALMITAPVLYHPKDSFWSRFLDLDLISLVGITAASIQKGAPTMVNGANLFFTKQVFYDVNGYSGNENIASGDDVFLMQKIHQRFPESISFLKDLKATATTKSPKSFREFVNQRIRWTSKSSRYADLKVRFTLTLNYFFYLFIFLNLFVLGVFKLNIFLLGCLMFGIKLIIDYCFFNNLWSFFKREDLKKYFLPIEIVHLPYISILGLLSLWGRYTWKNRKV